MGDEKGQALTSGESCKPAEPVDRGTPTPPFEPLVPGGRVDRDAEQHYWYREELQDLGLIEEEA